MFVDIDSFLQELKGLKDEILPETKIEVIYKRIDKTSLRISINHLLFIDVYANTETNRYDFSLIKDNKRAFGYDNLGGWHYHPYNNPDYHIKCSEPLLKHIFKEISRVVQEL